METFSPAFVFKKDLEHDDLVKELAEVLYCNQKLEDQETGFNEIEILFEYGDGCNWLEKDSELYLDLTHKAKILVDERIKTEEKFKEQEKEQQTKKIAQDKEAKERAQYERLKAKFNS
jgi:hypothetical protein